MRTQRGFGQTMAIVTVSILLAGIGAAAWAEGLTPAPAAATPTPPAAVQPTAPTAAKPEQAGANQGQPAAQPKAAVDRWRGRVQTGEAANDSFDFVVQFTGGLADKRGTITIPSQNVRDGKLSKLSVHDKAMNFTFVPDGAPEALGAVFTSLVRDFDPDSASGSVLQNGVVYPVELARIQPGEEVAIGPKRPQTPKEPLPYRTSEVVVSSGSGESAVKLAGTLTLPEAAKFKPPYPAVVFITGSGPQDRDETIFDHRPFAVLADALARAGVASVRCDDRGVGGSGNIASDPLGQLSTTDDFARDALAGVAMLAGNAEIDSKRIGLLGHSEGALAAAMAAAEQPGSVAFVVMMAGQGTNGEAVLKQQMRALAIAGGAPMSYVEQVGALQAELLRLARDKETEKIRPAIEKLAMAQMGLTSMDQLRAKQKEALMASLDAQAKAMLAPWMQRWLALEPREYLIKVRGRVLVLQGGLDTQVVAAENVPAIVSALTASGKAEVTVRVLPKLNHLLQPARTGAPDEYASIEQTMDPAAVQAVVEFVVGR